VKRLLVTAIVIVLGTGRVSRAEDEWAKGVPADKQKQANALFAEANQLVAQQAHQPALEKYKAALELWDHPLIRFNRAYAEIRLDRVLEAAEDLDKALQYGQAPFPTKELYEQALAYQTLIKGRVGDVSASCEQADVKVSLDGRPWFNCPGNGKQRVLSGEHVILGERKDYIPQSRRVVVGGGKATVEKINLLPIDSAVVLKYPYPRWIPFTIAGGGAAIALGGLAFWFAGRNQMDKFESDFAMACPTGCDAALNMTPQEKLLAEERDSAKLKGKIAVVMMIGGGAITATGVVMAIINSKAKRVMPLEVAPTPGGVAASFTGHF
jgi:hypothetical protein